MNTAKYLKKIAACLLISCMGIYAWLGTDDIFFPKQNVSVFFTQKQSSLAISNELDISTPSTASQTSLFSNEPRPVDSKDQYPTSQLPPGAASKFEDNHSSSMDISNIISEVRLGMHQKDISQFISIIDSLSAAKANQVLPLKIQLNKLFEYQNSLLSISNDQYLIEFPKEFKKESENFLRFADTSLNQFRHNWGLFWQGKKILVRLYPQPLFQSFIGNLDIVAIYDGTIVLSIEKKMSMNQLKSRFRHELVHALLDNLNSQTNLPKWFEEGLAQFLECIGGCQVSSISLTRSNFLSHSIFLNRDRLHFYNPDAILFYQQSLFLIQTLTAIKGDGWTNPLNAVISEIEYSFPKNSDELLDPAGLTFDTLYEESKIDWQKNSHF